MTLPAWMYNDPMEIMDRFRKQQREAEALEKELKVIKRRKRRRRIKKLVKDAINGKRQGK